MCPDKREVIVWSRFQRTLEDGSVIKYRIEQCPDERFDELSEFMIKYFMKDELWNYSAELEHDELATKEFMQLQTAYYPKRLCQICVVDDGSEKPEIVGFNILDEIRKGACHHNFFEPKSKGMTILFNMLKEVDKYNNIFERFNTDAYISDGGLSVSPSHRKRGIAGELLRARVLLAESMGIKVVGGSFTATFSQKAAENQGYESFHEIDYEEFSKNVGAEIITDTPTVKIMAHVSRK